MLNHLDGPTLIVTKLPDGGLAWTVIDPREVEVSSTGMHGMWIELKIRGHVLTGDWRYGPPPADWECVDAEPLPAGKPLLGGATVHQLPPGVSHEEG